MGSPVIAPARPEHSSGIVAAIRSGFTPEILGATVYGCHGIVRFIEGQIGLPMSVADTTWTVATPSSKGSDSGTTIGCVELRRSPDFLFLNYISVMPAYRGAGLGKKMLHTAVTANREIDQREMLLDVLTDDVVANRWYDRLGFEDQARGEWWDLGPCSSLHGRAGARGSTSGFISGHPQASVSQREFGFSQFNVTTSEGSSTIGCLGTNWFRVTRPEALRDPAVAAALAFLDPKRHILAILPAGTLPKAVRDRARPIACTVRKIVNMELLTNRLRG
jgi:ribosomal protein S18 acetylase RimI-like enzyme